METFGFFFHLQSPSLIAKFLHRCFSSALARHHLSVKQCGLWCLLTWIFCAHYGCIRAGWGTAERPHIYSNLTDSHRAYARSCFFFSWSASELCSSWMTCIGVVPLGQVLYTQYTVYSTNSKCSCSELWLSFANIKVSYSKSNNWPCVTFRGLLVSKVYF